MEPDDLPVTVEDVVGTMTYEDVLYTVEKAEETIQRTEKAPREPPSIPTVRAFAEEVQMTDVPCVAELRPAEEIDTVGHSLYSARKFYHEQFVGPGVSLAYRRAWDADEYEVTYDADYESGDLTITVEEVD